MSAHAHHYDSVEDPGPLSAPKLNVIAIVCVVLGLVGAGLVLSLGGTSRLFSSLLQAMLLPTFVGAAAMFYISVHTITGAVWMQPLRRIMEGLSCGVWIGAAFFLVVGSVGAPYLFDWVYNSGEAHDHLFHVHGGSKGDFMNWTRYFIMNVAIFAIWCFFQFRLTKLSVAQDGGKDIKKVHFNTSVAYLLFFPCTITFFVWDNLLSLHVNWFSTMWGVYCFASAVQTFLAIMILLSLWLRRGPMKKHIGQHALHDLGTWMVAWSCFCAYIGFSQFMLIWYANLDEETYWFVIRTQNGYGLQIIIEGLIRWPLIFLGLMSQSMRTRPAALIVICSMALVGNWMDWSWIIMPAFAINEYRSPFGPELLVGIGMAGLFLLVVLKYWSKFGLIPKGEPRLLESINAEHLH